MSSSQDAIEKELIYAGLAYAKAEGAQPLLVVPSKLSMVEAPSVLIDDDLFDAGRRGFGQRGAELADAMVVFPADVDLLNAAIAAGRVPRTKAAIVLAEGVWRRVRSIDSCGAASVPPLERLTALTAKLGMGAARLQRFRTVSSARALQPYLDKRERGVLATLQAPGNFPYRLTHVVEKRVLVGSGTLDGGGAERQIINTIEGLRARRIDDVHLLVEYLDEGKANAFYLDKAAKVAASIVRPADGRHGTHPWLLEHPRFRAVVSDWLANTILRNAETIKRLSPEIVQCSLDWPNITIGMAAVLAGVPHVFISGRNVGPRHFAFFQWFMFPCYRALVAHPNVHFLNNSEAGRDDYARWLRLPSRKIRVLRNGLHTGEFVSVDDEIRNRARSELGVPSSARVVAGAFRLSDEKRPALWLDTAARIKSALPEAIFLHCGIGPLQPQVEAHARRLGLSDSVRFLGARKDIQTIFAAADLLLHTSLLEGTPNSLIEAQAMGIPVVTTPARGAAEAVEHGVTGLVVGKETASALAAAAIAILSDPCATARARQAGPVFVTERFGFDRMIDDTLEAYADAGVPWAADFLPPTRQHLAHVEFDGSQIIHDGGHAFRVHLPQFVDVADTSGNTRRSSLCVLEDGRPLGPAHTPHDTIRTEGMGGFSHWGQWCYFSSSDGTPVTANGRRYSAVFWRVPLRTHPDLPRAPSTTVS